MTIRRRAADSDGPDSADTFEERCDKCGRGYDVTLSEKIGASHRLCPPCQRQLSTKEEGTA